MYNKRDKNKYQGRNFDFIGIDELTHFTYDEFEALRSRNRPQGPGTRVYMRMTCNPGGIGHGWVKERYIAGKEPLKRYVREIEIEGKRYAVSSCFVPATVFDNPSLLDNDPDYVARLGTLPEALKKALLYGDWDSFSGQVFTEFRDDAAHYLSLIHIFSRLQENEIKAGKISANRRMSGAAKRKKQQAAFDAAGTYKFLRP